MAPALTRLSSAQEAEALAFCRRCRPVPVAMAGWIHLGGLYGSEEVPEGYLYREHDFEGLVHISKFGVISPLCRTHQAMQELVALASMRPHLARALVGPAQIVEVLLDKLKTAGFQELKRREQWAYELAPDNLLEGPSTPLQAGDASMLAELVQASAEMAREEARDDPQSRNPKLFEERVFERIVRGRDYVLFDEQGRLLYKATISTHGPLGGHLEGIYTSKWARNRGIGTDATRWLCQQILSRSERVQLLVNDDNYGAQRVYERIGFARIYRSLTVFIS